MSVIVCNLNMFDAMQTFRIVKDGVSKDLCELYNEDIGSTIAELCHSLKISKVHLFGVSEYVEHYGEEIKKSEQTKYSTSNIQIELN